MGASLVLDLSGLKKLIDRFTSPAVIQDLNSIPQSKAIAALVSQAIADNFDKEGPGWAPLKGDTLRKSVAKGMMKHAQREAADQMGILRYSKAGKPHIRDKDLAGNRTELNYRTGKVLQKMELHARKVGSEPGRMILQKTGLLKKSATTPNYSGSNAKGVTGKNIYKVEGTNLIWGVDLIYARVHNQGFPKRGIPKREFLVIRDEWMKQISDYMVERVLMRIRKAIIGGET